MTADTWLMLAAIVAIGSGVLMGPMLLTVRAVMQRHSTLATIRRWQGAVALGLGLGLVGATAVSGLLINGQMAVLAATLGLLSLLAILDLAWRWLPFAWTLPLLGLGIASAWFSDAMLTGGMGLLAGAGVLLALQLSFRVFRGVEALGTGDIWLAAGLGMLTGPQEIVAILGIAALTGLVAAGLQRLVAGPSAVARMGVAYGTHLCVAYVIILLF